MILQCMDGISFKEDLVVYVLCLSDMIIYLICIFTILVSIGKSRNINPQKDIHFEHY